MKFQQSTSRRRRSCCSHQLLTFVQQSFGKNKNLIQKKYGVPARLNIEEVKKPELYAKLVAENIAFQLERRMSFRRAIKSAAAATMRSGAKGIRIQVSGRLNNAEMARREKEIQGSVFRWVPPTE